MTETYDLFKEPLVKILSILFSLVTPNNPSSRALLLAISVSALNEYGSKQARSANDFLFNKMSHLVRPSLNVW